MAVGLPDSSLQPALVRLLACYSFARLKTTIDESHLVVEGEPASFIFLVQNINLCRILGKPYIAQKTLQ